MSPNGINVYLKNTFLKSRTPRWIVFLIDLLICFFSIVCAFYIRFNFNVPHETFSTFYIVIPFVLFVRALLSLIFKTYANLVRYTSIKDTERIFKVVAFGSLIIFCANFLNVYFLNGTSLIPNSVIIIDFLFTAFAMTASRLLIKTLYHEINNPSKFKANIIILGTNQHAVITKLTIDRDAGDKNKVVAFIDSNKKQIGNNIEGIPIFDIAELDDLIERFEVNNLIIGDRGFNISLKTQVINKCIEKKVKVFTIPDPNTWINGDLSYNQIKGIKIEDLLEREPIKLDTKGIRKELINKVILVTGAAGSIGNEIVKQISKFYPKKILLFDQAESPLYDLELELKENSRFDNFEIIIGDVTNYYRLEKVFEEYKPNVVYHAAAYKHVPMMEKHPTESILVNVWGTKNVADLSIEHKVSKFVMVSTDKAVNPTNVMGASKRIAEMYIQSLTKISSTQFVTTRFGNVLGSNGSVIPRFRKQIESGGPVTITHPEVTRYFMTISEACQLVLEAGAMGKGGEIFIFDMGESVKILDLAKKMISLNGLVIGKDIRIDYTGLRPGEKLYEELLADSENTTHTHHPKIMIAKIEDRDPIKIKKDIKDLLELLVSGNDIEIVKEMKKIVPEFKSQNSIYEELDIEVEEEKSL